MCEEEFKTSNLVIVSNLSSEILNLRQLYDCLVIHNIEYTVGTKLLHMKREKVPFFGKNGIIIGLKYGKEYRGILRPKGHLNNLIGLDMQLKDKNNNIKIGSRKFHIMGVKSIKDCEDTLNFLCDHLDMTNKNFSVLLSLSEETKAKLREWVIANYGYIEEQTYKIKTFEECYSIVQNSPFDDPMELKALTYITMFVITCKDLIDYNELLGRLISYKSQLFKNTPKISDITICNGVYVYSLKKSFSLFKVSQIINKIKRDDMKPKYCVSFHNWSSKKQLKITLPINLENGDPHGKTKLGNKLAAHRFTISQNGSVKQYSPTSISDAHNAYLELVEDFNKYVFIE